jgi:hypothetical protein
MLDEKQRSATMAKTTGKVVETPTQEMPFKAVILSDGKIISEQFCASRPEAEAFIVEALKGRKELPQKGGRLR